MPRHKHATLPGPDLHDVATTRAHDAHNPLPLLWRLQVLVQAQRHVLAAAHFLSGLQKSKLLGTRSLWCAQERPVPLQRPPVRRGFCVTARFQKKEPTRRCACVALRPSAMAPVSSERVQLFTILVFLVFGVGIWLYMLQTHRLNSLRLDTRPFLIEKNTNGSEQVFVLDTDI